MRHTKWVIAAMLVGGLQACGPLQNLQLRDREAEPRATVSDGAALAEDNRVSTQTACPQANACTCSQGGPIQYPRYVDSNAERLQYRRQLQARLRAMCE